MIWLVLSILALLLGHIVKVYRWNLFIKLYERTPISVLLNSLSISSAINYVVPYHIGDLYRIWYSGRRMKNGIKFSLATVIVEHYIDLLVLAIVCTILYFMGHNTMGSMILFASIAATVLLLTIFAMRFDGKTKSLIVKSAGIFNQRIELIILGSVWAFVTIFKRMLKDISKLRITLSTGIMWVFYMGSYWCLAEYFQSKGLGIRLRDVVDIVFNKGSIVNWDMSSALAIPLTIYILTPLLIILLASFIINRFHKENEEKDQSSSIIPHVNSRDALTFLETFFNGNMGNAYLQGFMEVNKDVNILQDYSAGSNAVTLLCTDGNKPFFRKFAIGADGEKLYKQIEWLTKHEEQIPLPLVEGITKEAAYCSYDMEYSPAAQNFFTYIHTHSSDDAWSILKQAINDLDKNLYRYDQLADQKTIDEYITQKIDKNLRKIRQGAPLKSVLDYDDVYINGVKYHNLKHYDWIFEHDHLNKIFKESPVCDIHGDLTIENIICKNDDYYLIDPNTGNVLECPWLDLGKLFQSLHGGYEFLMRIQKVNVNENRIDFTFIRSSAYDELYNHLKQYIIDTYGENVLTQVYYHEIVHWLRLMPYKLSHIGERSLLFYAGMIIIMNDIVKE